MLARHVTTGQLNQAALMVGVRVDIRAVTPNRKSATGVVVRFGLQLGPDKQWQRVSANYFHQGRKIAAVCWHGHREFFRALYRINPAADIKTAMNHYTGPDQFEQVYRDGDRNIGAPIAPVMASEACRCPEGAWAD